MASTQNSNHPDDVVPQVQDVEEVPSDLVAQARLRHEQAKEDTATPQERKQAAVELAHATATRPDGSYAQLHETDPAQGANPTLAVADDRAVSEGRKSIEQARDDLGEGAAPAGSDAARKVEDARTETATRSTSDAETRPAAETKRAGK